MSIWANLKGSDGKFYRSTFSEREMWFEWANDKGLTDYSNRNDKVHAAAALGYVRAEFAALASRMLDHAIGAQYDEAHSQAEGLKNAHIGPALTKCEDLSRDAFNAWDRDTEEALDEAYDGDRSLKTAERKWERAAKALDSKYHSEVALAEKERDQVIKAKTEQFDQDVAVLDAAKRSFEGVRDEEHKKLVEQLMRNPDTVYSLPMAICTPFWKFMVSAEIRWLVLFRENEEPDAPPVVADNVVHLRVRGLLATRAVGFARANLGAVPLVQLKIKKGGNEYPWIKVQLRPAKGLPPPRCRRAAAPKRPPRIIDESDEEERPRPRRPRR